MAAQVLLSHFQGFTATTHTRYGLHPSYKVPTQVNLPSSPVAPHTFLFHPLPVPSTVVFPECIFLDCSSFLSDIIHYHVSTYRATVTFSYISVCLHHPTNLYHSDEAGLLQQAKTVFVAGATVVLHRIQPKSTSKHRSLDEHFFQIRPNVSQLLYCPGTQHCLHSSPSSVGHSRHRLSIEHLLPDHDDQSVKRRKICTKNMHS